MAGFVWFQGWNDMINAEYTAEYTTNLTHFIRDVRKDLKAPKLPFVIGQMGVDGTKANPGVKRFKDAQAAVMHVPEFKGNVALVKTDVFWDTDADAVFRKGWRQAHRRMEQGGQRLSLSLSRQPQDDVPDRQGVRRGDARITA